MDYEDRPLLVYWELTRACDLACRHCRAKAMPQRHPLELSTQEGYALLDTLAGFGTPLPHLVLTGGDPLMRPDLFDIIARAKELGFTVAVTPATTRILTEKIVQRMQQAGVGMLALSLDGSGPQSHDTIRGVSGSFARTLQAARWAGAVGLPLQINTLVCAETLNDLPAVFARLTDTGITQWALFFLIQVGRGQLLQEVTPDESEELMRWVYEISRNAPFRIRTTEAPHYRRFALQQQAAEPRNKVQTADLSNLRGGFGVRDGSGVMFISNIGEVYPSGFLPMAAGNVRRDDPVDIYRNGPLFRILRDTSQLKGKCGRCEYRQVCGGSRARAYAATGDPLASDLLCPYVPTSQGTDSVLVGRS